MIQQHGGPTGCFVSQEGRELLRWSIITKRGVLHILLVRGRMVLLHEGQEGHSHLVAKRHGEREKGRSAKPLMLQFMFAVYYLMPEQVIDST